MFSVVYAWVLIPGEQSLRVFHKMRLLTSIPLACHIFYKVKSEFTVGRKKKKLKRKKATALNEDIRAKS